MRSRGRPILGIFSGFFAGLFLGLSLLFYGVIPLESNLLVILPVAGLVIVFILAMWFPLWGKRPQPAPAATAPAGGDEESLGD